MKRFAKRLPAEHPNITIEFQNVPAEQASQKLTTQLAGGNPPDVAYVNASDTADFALARRAGRPRRLHRRSDVVKPDDYVEAFKTFVTYEDSMYGLPIDGESTGLFYRTDMFEAAGIDEPADDVGGVRGRRRGADRRGQGPVRLRDVRHRGRRTTGTRGSTRPAATC